MYDSTTTLLLLTSGLLLLSLLLQIVVKSKYVPHLVLYLLLGILLTQANLKWNFLSAFTQQGIGFLAEIGIILLLFKVGMKSNIHGLLKQLPLALRICLVNILVSGGAAYAATYLLSYGNIESLVMAFAFMATSVGISVSVWKHHRILNTPQGEILLDIAELDDIISVSLLTLLFAIAPTLQETGFVSWQWLGIHGFLIILKLLLFIVFLIVFSLYIEPHITRFLQERESQYELSVFLVATGILVAVCAELIGLSLAIGAFLAGLAIGRDKILVKKAIALPALSVFFVPFFFINIGMHMTVSVASLFNMTTASLLLAAVVGKFIGTSAPAYPIFGAAGAVLLGASMLPRAEISLIVAQKAWQEDLIPQILFSSVIVIATLTTLITPLLVKWLLSFQTNLPNKKD